MLSESQRLNEQIMSLESTINKLPEGKIFCTRNGNRYKWYRSDGHHQVYIPKKNHQLAEQLAAKKYLSHLCEELRHEKNAIDFYLRHHDSKSSQAEHMLTNMPEYQELLSPFFQPLSQQLYDWAKSPYPHNPKFPEQLIHKTSSGNLVRSKSEALIDMMLYINKIPFRYECALQLDETIIYPDFTIRHPITGNIYYWEHFGRMDDPNYSKNAFSKLQLYASHGIIPTIQLITTYETLNTPLSSDAIEKIIADYFLKIT